MRKRLLFPLLLLLITACGTEAPVIKTQLHLVQGVGFETLLEGTADLDGGRIEQSLKGKSLPIDLQVVVTREGEIEDFTQQTLTFKLQERGDQFVLTYDEASGPSEPVTAPKANGLESFLKSASEQIATIANAQRDRLKTP